MFKLDFKKALNVAAASASENMPELVMGVGLGLMVIAIGHAIGATKKATEAVEEAKEDLGMAPEDELSPKEVFKVSWKYYIPTAVAAAVGAGCIIKSDSIHQKRNAALAAAYALSDSALQEYQKKVVEMVGEDKAKEIRSEINNDTLRCTSADPDTVTNTGKGTDLFFDKLTSRYFLSNRNAIIEATNNLNWEMTRGGFGYVSLNEFYDSIGLESADPLGDALGWNADKGLIEPQFDSKLDQHGHPCVVLYFTTPPKYGYQTWK